jgi:hypothetical protein
MRRTPPLVAAAAALGLLAGLVLEARASGLDGEVSPHTVTVAWLTPSGPFPAGVPLDEPGVVPADGRERMTRLSPMRARVPEHVVAQREARLKVSRKLLVRDGGCPDRHRESHAEARVELRRS